MTTPVERMRSLRWGRELLESLQSDTSLPEGFAARAALLAPTFPTPQALTRLLEADVPRWPPEFSVAIDGARLLFEEIQFDGHGSRQTRRDVLYTLRHFPLQRASTWAAAASVPGGLRNWLAPEHG